MPRAVIHVTGDSRTRTQIKPTHSHDSTCPGSLDQHAEKASNGSRVRIELSCKTQGEKAVSLGHPCMQ